MFIFCFAYICMYIYVCTAATDVNYPTPNRFGNLVLPDVQTRISGECEVTVRLPGLGIGGQPLNANSPRSVSVEVQSQWWERNMQSTDWNSLHEPSDRSPG